MDVDAALQRWTPDPVVRSRHVRRADASAADLWAAARSVALSDTRTLGRLIRWRIPGTAADLSFAQLFARYPFTVLDAGETWSVSGLCGEIWTLRRDYPRLGGAADFEAWDRAGTVKVAFGHWVRPAGDGAELLSEARVTPLGTRARLQTRALWTVVGRFERLIGAEPLAVAVRRAGRD